MSGKSESSGSAASVSRRTVRCCRRLASGNPASSSSIPVCHTRCTESAVYCEEKVCTAWAVHCVGPRVGTALELGLELAEVAGVEDGGARQVGLALPLLRRGDRALGASSSTPRPDRRASCNAYGLPRTACHSLPVSRGAARTARGGRETNLQRSTNGGACDPHRTELGALTKRTTHGHAPQHGAP